MITMSMRELDRLKVIQAVIEERLMPHRGIDLSASAFAFAA
jgi:hypothetical protein